MPAQTKCTYVCQCVHTLLIYNVMSNERGERSRRRVALIYQCHAPFAPNRGRRKHITHTHSNNKMCVTVSNKSKR